MSRVELPTHLIDFWSLKSLLKSLEVILISMKSNDFKITYAMFLSVGPLALTIAQPYRPECIDNLLQLVIL